MYNTYDSVNQKNKKSVIKEQIVLSNRQFPILLLFTVTTNTLFTQLAQCFRSFTSFRLRAMQKQTK
jgi:hypothetical protein